MTSSSRSSRRSSGPKVTSEKVVALEPSRSPAENAEKTLQSLNSEAGIARNVWISFNLLLLFISITLAGVTHEDLFFETPMRIPVVDVNVPLTWFFVVVPLLILILQIGVLMEHVLLSQKAQEINELLTQAGDRELSDRIKYRASTYFFVQDVISPNHSWLISAGLRIITWVTLEFFPICTLILVQLKFLPYQDGWITGLHRVVIALAALNIIAARISRRKTLSWRNDLKLPLITLASKLIKLLTIPIEPLIAVVLSCFIALGANEKRRFYDFSFIGERIGLFGFGADESTGHTSSVFSQRLYLPEVSLRKGAYGGDYGGTIGTCACGGYSGTPFFQPKFPDHDQANFDTKFFAHLVKACPAYNEVDAKVQAVLSVWSEEVGERGR